MGKPLDITDRTFEFAVRVVKLSQVLDEQPGAGQSNSKCKIENAKLSESIVRSG